MSSRLFHILLLRAASTIGANIYEIIGENTGKLIGVAAEVVSIPRGRLTDRA